MKSNAMIRIKLRSALHAVGRKSARVMVRQTNGGCRRPGHAHVLVWHDGFRFDGPCGGWIDRKRVATETMRYAHHVAKHASCSPKD